MRGQAVHEERVICRQVHELSVHLEALEFGKALVVFCLVTHRGPGVGNDHVGTGDGLERIVEQLDRGAGHRRDLLAFGHDDGVGCVNGGEAQLHVHARQHAHFEIGVRHVVAVTHVGDREPGERTLVLANRQGVSETLAGMKLVGERVDDGDARPTGDFLDLFLLEGAQHDGIHESLEHECRVLDGLATAERRMVIAHDERMRSQAVGADLETRARAQARLLHDDGDGLARAGGIVHAVSPGGLLPGGRIEHEDEFLGRQIEQPQAIATGKRVRTHRATSS